MHKLSKMSTLNISGGDLSSCVAGFRLTSFVDSFHSEPVLPELFQIRHHTLTGGEKFIGLIDSLPVSGTFLLHLHNVAFDWAAAVFGWRFPC